VAALSDAMLVVAVLGYLAAMIGHAAEYAFGPRGAVARVAATVPSGAPTRVPRLSAEPAEGRPPREAAPTGARARTRGELTGRIALAALLLAAVAHAAAVTTRGIAAGRVPWGDMYEFLLTGTFIGVVTWLVVLRRWPAVRHLGLYVALANVLLLGLAGMVVYVPVGPLQPALDSYWLVIHVAAAALAAGIFLIGFVAAVMYLIRAGADRGRSGFPYTLAPRLPAAAVLERLAFRLHAFGFPIWTFAALIAGPIWAEAAWGRYWGWDPKEVWAFISWVVYAAYLHARATPSVSRTTAAWLAIAGWLTMLMNLFGVNLFFEGLHSYAGV
jgi:cytochrome c-type biogenesis protein CcsB